MAKITKMLTYSIPDCLYSLENTLGKTSTQLYEGPEEIVMWLDKETGYLMQAFAPEDEPDRPLPLDLKREILRADTDINCCKIGLIYGGLEAPKIYEVSVGPVDQPNATVVDPSDIRIVYDKQSVTEDYTAPLKFFEYKRIRDDAFIRNMRDAKLAASDGKISPDMPEALKQQWLDYRQKLRDLPVDWADVPNYLVRFPRSPEDGPNMEFEDEHVHVIRIEDRDASDADALQNLPPGVY
jgi:hypothetical protein